MAQRPAMILIQAASRAWSGGQDLCMRLAQGHIPAVQQTAAKALATWPGIPVVIIAPEYDRGCELEQVKEALIENGNISIYYGFDASPLDRMLAATESCSEEDCIVRIDGLHFGWIPDVVAGMYELAIEKRLDCVKLPDDFPAQISSDIYRVGALRKMRAMLQQHPDSAVYAVHPKYFMFFSAEFTCAFFECDDIIDDTYLQQCREAFAAVYDSHINVILSAQIASGNQFSFRYELAQKYISKSDVVLDIACATGWGTRMLAEHAKSVIGGDIEPASIAAASIDIPSNVHFQVEDCLAMSFADETFDVVVSCETLEHVDAAAFLQECRRVLKLNGILVISTPQNRFGHIPITIEHTHEFSAKELRDVCGSFFHVITQQGLKQGRILKDGDPLGASSFIVCKKIADD